MSIVAADAEPVVRIAYDRTREDFYVLMREILSSHRFVRLMSYGGLLLMVLVGAWEFVRPSPESGDVWMHMSGPTSALLLLCLAPLLWLMMQGRNTLNNWLRTETGRRSLCRVEVTVGEAGVVATGPDIETRVRWSGVLRIAERNGRILVFIASNQAFILPRRAFESEQQYKACLAFAQAQLPGAACPQCGYNLAGGRGGCPECGWGRREAPELECRGDRQA